MTRGISAGVRGRLLRAPTPGAATVLAALLATVAGQAGCGGGTATTKTVVAATPAPPQRAVTAGDRLLKYAPAGANAVLELDIARLRDNAVVGAVVAVLAADAGTSSFQPWRDADSIAFVAYHMGTPQARMLTLVGAGSVAPPAVNLGQGVWALGPPQDIDAAIAVTAGRGPALIADQSFLTRRAQAMPEAAKGGALRATAMLEFDARVGLASLLDLAAVPREISIWADVVDDAALIVWTRGDDDADGARLAAVAEHLRSVLSTHPDIRRLRLVPPLAQMKLDRRQDVVRAVAVVGPSRLARAAKLARQLFTERNASEETSP